MRIFQQAELSDDPVGPMNAVTKQYVDSLVSVGGGGSSSGGLFFTDVQPTNDGNIALKQYVENTVPANKVIKELTTDTDNITVSLIAEGSGVFYSPTIVISATPQLPGLPSTLLITETSSRFFSGSMDLSGVTQDTIITASNNLGSSTTISVHRAVAGPVVDLLLIGSLPGSQIEAKSGDVIPVSGRVTNAATYIEIISAGASNGVFELDLDAPNSFGAGYKSFSGTFTVGSRSGAQFITARSSNDLGTFGDNVNSNTITLNQTSPTIGSRIITYPSGQTAIKGAETVTVTSTISNYDSVSYTTSANLQVTNPTTYTAAKSVKRLSGTYLTGTNNYTITATKTSNNSQTIAYAAISIADSSPTANITITGAPLRLISSPAGTDYVVKIVPNQTVSVAPTLIASAGTWQGAWTVSGNVWSRVLRIIDTDPKGIQTFSALTLKGIAGATGNTITSGASYTIGGFSVRTIAFPAFSRFAPLGTSVGDITKVIASYTGAATLALQGSTADAFQGFTIVDSTGAYNPNGGFVFLNDSAFAGSNTTGTLQVDISEGA